MHEPPVALVGTAPPALPSSGLSEAVPWRRSPAAAASEEPDDADLRDLCGCNVPKSAETMIAADPAKAAMAPPDRTAAVAAEASTATSEPAAETAPETVAGSAPSAPETPAGAAAEVAETGDPRVDAALRRLADVDVLPTDEHAPVYEDVHRRLRDALAGVDDSGNAETSSEDGAPPDLATDKG